MTNEPRFSLTDADGLADNTDPAFIVLDIRRRDIETGNIASALERLHALTDSSENMRLTTNRCSFRLAAATPLPRMPPAFG